MKSNYILINKRFKEELLNCLRYLAYSNQYSVAYTYNVRKVLTVNNVRTSRHNMSIALTSIMKLLDIEVKRRTENSWGLQIVLTFHDRMKLRKFLAFLESLNGDAK